MDADSKFLQGTSRWFEMVGALMCKAASESGLSPGNDVSLIERYLDGVTLSEGVIQGLCFEISNGKPSFRVGVREAEIADIVIEVTSVGARTLNMLYQKDPRYQETIVTLLRAGEMRVAGDLGRLGDWVNTIHDAVVDRTA